MRRRKSKSSNPSPESTHPTTPTTTSCQHCQNNLNPTQRPRVNARGLRLATVSPLFQGAKRVPMLRLTGRWLAAAGFDIGQLIEIKVERGKLTILIDSEMAEETRPIAA